MSFHNIIRPLYIFIFILLVRHIIQSVITRRIRREGEKSDLAGTALLSVCYITVMVLTGAALWNMVGFSVSFIAGIVVMAAFISLRINALITLGDYFSYEIRIAIDHKLIRNGIYGIIRHPLHLAFWGEVAGMAIAGNNLISYGVCILLFLVILHRNKVEDKILAEKFGEDFSHYCEEVPSMNILAGVWRMF